MARVVRKGDKCSGHEGYPPRPNIEGIDSLVIDGIPVHCVGQHWAFHSRGSDTHDGITLQGTIPSSITVEGKNIALVGYPISCGSVCAEGSPTTEF